MVSVRVNEAQTTPSVASVLMQAVQLGGKVGNSKHKLASILEQQLDRVVVDQF